MNRGVVELVVLCTINLSHLIMKLAPSRKPIQLGVLPLLRIHVPPMLSANRTNMLQIAANAPPLFPARPAESFVAALEMETITLINVRKRVKYQEWATSSVGLDL